MLTTGPNDLRGTYIDSKLACMVAIWISPEFAYKVSDIVENFLVREKEDEIRKLTGEKCKLEKMFEKAEQRREEAEQRAEKMLLNMSLQNEKTLLNMSLQNEKTHTKLDNTHTELVKTQTELVKTHTKLDKTHTKLDKTRVTLNRVEKRVDKIVDIIVPPEKRKSRQKRPSHDLYTEKLSLKTVYEVRGFPKLKF